MLANEKDNLKQFLVKAKAFLKHFENAIGWKWDDNDQVQECTICPVNNGHRVPQKRFVAILLLIEHSCCLPSKFNLALMTENCSLPIYSFLSNVY